MTIGSVVVMHVLVLDKEHALSRLSEQMISLEDRIESLWLDANRTESSGNHVLVLLSREDEKSQELGRSLLVEQLPFLEVQGVGLEPLVKAITAHRKDTIHRINDIYAERLELEAERRDVEHSIKLYMRLGLLLQALGLLLILSRDVFGRETLGHSVMH